MGSLWAFGVSGILLMFVGYWVFDKLTPRIDFAKELVENKNVAVAIMIGSIIFGVAVIVAATMLPYPFPTQ
jgi:putative membrane protein